jgi:hypothetical protein
VGHIKVYSNDHHPPDDAKEGILYVAFSVMPGELECAMNNLFVRCVFIYL